jgi:6-phosphogluconolactonase
MLHGRVVEARDAEAVADEAARIFVDAARLSIDARGRFLVALAGGRTPRALYERLAKPPHRAMVDWPRVTVLFSDERCVPPDDERSNFRMAHEALLAHVPASVHRMRGELSPDEGAREYEAVLRSLGAETLKHRTMSGESVQSIDVPRLDLVLLGMGPEGHTASLFPHQPALAEERRLCIAAKVPAEPPDRITFTLPTIDAARAVLITVAGRDKAPVMRIVREAPDAPGPLADEHPILHVRPSSGELFWVLDAALAGS